MKDAFYFPHDYNASRDENIIKLRRVHKWSGVGLYWALVEKLYDAGGKISADFELWAHDLQVKPDFVKSLVMDFGLFYIKKEKIGSHSVDRRLDERRQKSEKAKRSASAKWANADAERTHTDRNARKERKGKERKEKKEKEKIPAQQHPFSQSFCTYNDKGQGRCQERTAPRSRFCQEHKLKIHEKFLTRREPLKVPALQSF